jgi:hypothetical protein
MKEFTTCEEAKRYFKKTGKVSVVRTGQWEYTAFGYGMTGKDTSEQGAELDLLRNYVKELEKEITAIKMGCVPSFDPIR